MAKQKVRVAVTTGRVDDDDGVFGERKWKTSGVDDGKQKEKGRGTGLLSFEVEALPPRCDGRVSERGEKSILIGVALWCY
ncbi:hypothetical protein K0M31_002155 [Melipona bicolor]|uniref:Uncharacterized protein n=1 Tax=Melipona bicolor TaxID=60889 RepID=A0AA40KYX5_9HYME|nr:hypothetical protein K0M31_002155 [Melipona bicolor]